MECPDCHMLFFVIVYYYRQHCAQRKLPVFKLLRGRFIPRLHNTPVVSPVVQPVCRLYRVNKHPNELSNWFDNRLVLVSTIQPVVKPVVKPVVQPFWQPVERTATVRSTGCQSRLYNWFDNRYDNRFDNRLYRVYKHSTGCQTGMTIGLTTGCVKRGFTGFFAPQGRHVAPMGWKLAQRPPPCQISLPSVQR